MRMFPSRSAIALLSSVALTHVSLAQSCLPSWSAEFTSMDLTGSTRATVVWDDDGAGPNPPALFVGGFFDQGGGRQLNGIGRFDGRSWSPLQGGFSSTNGQTCAALALYDDDGPGPRATALYAAGDFFQAGGVPANWIARWDGSNWTALGSGLAAPGASGFPYARALCVFDEDGAGPAAPALFVGGDFTTAGGATVRGLARWNGTTWSAVGGGLGGSFPLVTALVVHDPDGAGPLVPSLYVGGDFTSAGGFGPSLARWTGSAWASAGTSGWNSVTGLASADHDGAGPAPAVLYATGYHFAPIDNWIGRYDGVAWSGVAGGVDFFANSVTAIDEDGAGPGGDVVYVGGEFTQAGLSPANHVARFDGSAWSALGSGVSNPFPPVIVYSAARFDEDGAGPAPAYTYFVGFFQTAGGVPMRYIARWDGSAWSTVRDGVTDGLHDLEAFDVDGPGPQGTELYAAGRFLAAGGTPANRVARYDGTAWSALGAGVDAVAKALCVFDDDGAGPNAPALFVGGEFANAGGMPASGIAKWDGANWSPLSSGVGGTVQALCVFDADGLGASPPELIAAGSFATAGGGPAANVARWNGSSWSGLGAGLGAEPLCLATFDEDGAGPSPAVLFAGGYFTTADGAPAGNIARWNGSAWSVVGGALGGATTAIFSMTVADTDGAGPLAETLVVGGYFTNFGGSPANYLAHWDGATWSNLGSGVNNRVWALAAFDDDGVGSAPAALYAAGDFTQAGGQPASGVAAWNGSTWSPLGSGVSGNQSYSQVVAALSVYDDDGAGAAPPALYAGGYLELAGGATSMHVARWGRPACSVVAFCAGDGTSVTACPCGNSGTIGHGCANSVFPTGALLQATGAPGLGADTLVLSGSAMPNSSALYFQGTTRVAGGSGSPFGDGLRCAGGSVVRLGTKLNTGNGSSYPGGGDLPISIKGLIPGPGAVRTYQVWYRNAAAFCTPETYNLSNGLSVTWGA